MIDKKKSRVCRYFQFLFEKANFLKLPVKLMSDLIYTATILHSKLSRYWLWASEILNGICRLDSILLTGCAGGSDACSLISSSNYLPIQRSLYYERLI